MDTKTLLNVLTEALRREEAGGMDPNYRDTWVSQQNNTMTWTQYQNARRNGELPNVRVKETSLTVAGNTTLYGCGGLFGLCGPDDIIGLSMMDDPLVPWLGFVPDTFCEKSVKAWVYTDQEGTHDYSVVGTVYGDECDNPPQTEKGVCEYYIGDFGTLRGCGEAVKVGYTGIRKCDKQPIYTVPVQGIGPIRIDNDLDLETINAAQLVKNELYRLLVTGDMNVAGQFDGLTNIVRTGYMSIKQQRCETMDSVVTDWENDDLSGAVNGHGSIISKVRDIWRQIRWRIQHSSLGMPAEGDVILLMPSFLAYQFLDEWAGWSFRAGAQYNEIFRDNLAIREFRARYEGGLFGNGYITIDGFNIHILAHDWAPISQSAPKFCADIYFLVRRLGTTTVLQGQYWPADLGADAVNNVAGYRLFNVEAFQGGRALRWIKQDNTCVQPCLMFRPRIWYSAPWAQGKIENVCVSVQFNPQSADPASRYFLGPDDVDASTHLTQYFYDDRGWFHPDSEGHQR